VRERFELADLPIVMCSSVIMDGMFKIIIADIVAKKNISNNYVLTKKMNK